MPPYVSIYYHVIAQHVLNPLAKSFSHKLGGTPNPQSPLSSNSITNTYTCPTINVGFCKVMASTLNANAASFPNSPVCKSLFPNKNYVSPVCRNNKDPNASIMLNPNAKSFMPSNKICYDKVNIDTTKNLDDEPPCQPYDQPISKIQKSSGTAYSECIEPTSYTTHNGYFSPSEHSSYTSLNDLRCKNINRIIFGQLNINSIRYKFDTLKDMVSGKIDILLLSETKIDDSFPTAQFMIPGYSVPYRHDRTKNGGGIMLYVRDDIPSKVAIDPQITNDIECIFIEVNFYKKKWLVGGSYNPSKTMIARHLEILDKHLNYYLSRYDNIILMGDFNSEPHEHNMEEFCALHNLKNLVHMPTCYKNVEHPSCIDLILTNRSKSFQNTVTIETGLSDFHKMILTVLKSNFKKPPPKIVTYREYKNYIPQNFMLELNYVIPFHILFTISNDKFMETFMEILNRHAPLKFKYIRMNQGPFMTKEIRKEVMKRSRLRNRFIADNSELNKVAYTRQRNKCTSLIRKGNKTFYSNLNPNRVTDNKTFWKTVKPLFSEKTVLNQNILLIDGDVIIKEDSNVSEVLSDFFSDAVKNLDICMGQHVISNDVISEPDPIFRAINKYKNHPSILKIIESRGDNGHSFSFSHSTLDEVYKELLILNDSTSCPKESIPPRIIKEHIDILALKIHHDINNSIDFSIFPNNLKRADVTPTHKKGDRTDKSNYRPISILPSISKVFERILFHQMNTHVENILSIHQCGFRKNFSAQYCLIVMLENWKKCVDKKGSSGILLTDLSKAFDCLYHDLMIAKLHAYGFNHQSLLLLYDYLTHRFQRVKVNSNYSSWKEIFNGVPQGSILGPMLFNIYLSDLFLFAPKSTIANYADDNSPYACKNNIDLVINQLEEDSNLLLQWCSNNALKANPDKFHLILSNTDESLMVNVGQYEIHNSLSEKLLGVTFDNKLTLNEHVTNLCKKASKKLHALARVSSYMNMEKRRVIMKSFINAQFGYCPLVWMMHSRILNNRINKIHERALRIVYDDNKSTFEELLCKDDAVSIHVRNIQALAIELFKVVNGQSPKIMEEVFSLKKTLSYCSKFPFNTRNVRTVAYGTNTLSHLGPKIWAIVPKEIKESDSLMEFKRKIRKWKAEQCPCRLCEKFVAGVGFVNITDKIF